MYEIEGQEKLLKSIKKYDDMERAMITKALNIAIKCHLNQFRDSGDPYVTHPIAVAQILVDLGLDFETVSAALLHDTIEDTEYTEGELLADFNAHILTLVEGVTKINKIKFKSRIDEQAENLRKMLLAMSHDIRVVIIKLADRLHNMRTLEFKKSEQSRKNKSKETLDIFAPIAARLGMGTVKCELEDLAMKWLYPKEYEEILNYLSKLQIERVDFIESCKDILKEKLDELNIEGEINGRPKHIYSIYKKMQIGKTLDEIYDLIALRVILPNIKDCYEMLGIIHTMWKPLPGRFKDYIATPKPNRYQSIHTTVFSKIGPPFEIQIRTYQMHKVAEFGIAAHWKYKQKKHFSTDKDAKLAWVNEMLEHQKETVNTTDALNSFKLDLYPDEIFVFTPESDVFTLPYGATALDFAYKIHSEVGNKCVGIKIDSKLMPFKTRLETGNIIEVITSKSQKGPSRDWLNIVETQQAKNKIRSYFKKTQREENIKNGKEMLELELKKKGIKLSEALEYKDEFTKIFNKFACNSFDDLYALIGFGDAQSTIIANKISQLKEKDEGKDGIEINKKTNKKTKNSSIEIDGYDNFKFEFSKCCNPVPGDNIMGYIAKNKGVCIHRYDCKNITDFEKERIIQVNWKLDTKTDVYPANITIISYENRDALSEISMILKENCIKVLALNLGKISDDRNQINLTIEIKNTEYLQSFIDKLQKNKVFLEVYRT